jgi:hypothetical protein
MVAAAIPSTSVAYLKKKMLPMKSAKPTPALGSEYVMATERGRGEPRGAATAASIGRVVAAERARPIAQPARAELLCVGEHDIAIDVCS